MSFLRPYHDSMRSDFHLVGAYRVQSRRRHGPSLLSGRWMDRDARLLDSAATNAALARHPAWRGAATVNLRPALVARREGMFRDEPDILYKREFFTPRHGATAMPADIVDVRKSCRLWGKRRSALSRLIGVDAVEAIEAQIGDLECVVANEYFCHEAGHMLGHDIAAKVARGYFRLSGATLWPLVFVEELRADLHAFGFALELLPPERAAAIFLYNLALRFGVHAAVERGGKAYGSVPYLLFHLLLTHGLIDVDRRSRLTVSVLDPAAARAAMRLCAQHAERHLTAAELDSDDLDAAAIHAARYYRERIDDGEGRRSFAAVFGAP